MKHPLRLLTALFLAPAAFGGDVVVAYHPEAAKIGERVLHEGGNAFDAFVAVTAAEYVLGEGVTSPAGPLGALTYSAKTGRVEYLDAWFNSPLDPTPGQPILVPGAMQGLEALNRKLGSRPFRENLRPAIDLARNGFTVTLLMNAMIESKRELLASSEYGRKTFLRDGKTIAIGERLTQGELADFLERVAAEGGDYVVHGAWSKLFLAAARGGGSKLTQPDLDRYSPRWLAPRATTYRGLDVFLPGGRSYGAVWTAMGLGVLSHWTPVAGAATLADSPADLATLIRVSRALDAELPLYSPEALDSAPEIARLMSAAHTSEIWNAIERPKPSVTAPGTHSYQVIVIDRRGNAVTGTHTINSFAWGDGIFVQGVPLPNAGREAPDFFKNAPGTRRINPATMAIAFAKGRKLRFVTGNFSGGMQPASLQFLTGLIDYRLSPEAAVKVPRFGVTDYNPDGSRTTLLSKRIGSATRHYLREQGILVSDPDSFYVDTGLGCAATPASGAFAPILEQ